MNSRSDKRGAPRWPRLAALAALLILAACSAPAPSGVRVLRYASPYPPNHTFSQADIVWMQYVEKASGGRLRIQPFWGGALISADEPVLEVRHGIADIALTTPSYTRAGMWAIKQQNGFYAGVASIPEEVHVYRCLEKTFPEFDHEMDGVKVLAVQGGSLPEIVTRSRPIHTLADLRGLRLRAPAEMTTVLQAMGVDVVTMPMGDTYSALSKGMIDGVVSPPDGLKTLHFSDVARYIGGPHIDRGAYPSRIISDRTWNSLPPDLQAVLIAATPVWESALSEAIARGQTDGEAYGKAHGVVFVPFPQAEQARYNELSRQVAHRVAASLIPRGIDGPAMLARTQAVIAADAAGKPPAC